MQNDIPSRGLALLPVTADIQPHLVQDLPHAHALARIQARSTALDHRRSWLLGFPFLSTPPWPSGNALCGQKYSRVQVRPAGSRPPTAGLPAKDMGGFRDAMRSGQEARGRRGTGAPALLGRGELEGGKRGTLPIGPSLRGRCSLGVRYRDVWRDASPWTQRNVSTRSAAPAPCSHLLLRFLDEGRGRVASRSQRLLASCSTVQAARQQCPNTSDRQHSPQLPRERPIRRRARARGCVSVLDSPK